MSAVALLPGLRPAGVVRRVVGAVADAVVPVLAVVAMVAGSLRHDSAGIALVSVGGVALVGWLALLAWLCGTRGATPGMRLAGTRLLGLRDARPVGVARYLRRARSQAALLVSVPGWLALWDGVRHNPYGVSFSDLRADAALVDAASARSVEPQAVGGVRRERQAAVLDYAASDAPAREQRFAAWGPIEHAPLSAEPVGGPDAPAPEAQDSGAIAPPSSWIPKPTVVPREPALPFGRTERASAASATSAASAAEPWGAAAQAPVAPLTFGRSARSAASATEVGARDVPPAPVPDFGRPAARSAAAETPAPEPEPAAIPAPARASLLQFRAPVTTPSDPQWQLCFDDGRVVGVEGLVLIGRQPETVGERCQLISIGADRRHVSKTHLAVAPDGDGLVVVDRGSTNGTAIDRGARGLAACKPGKQVPITAGTKVVFGDHSFTVSRATA